MKNLSIAIVSDVPPDPVYTAGQVLAKIIEGTPAANFSFFWINQSNLSDTKNFPANCRLQKKLNFQLGRVLSKLQHILFKIFEYAPRARALINVLFAALPAIFLGIKLSFELRRSAHHVVWLILQGEKLALTYFILIVFSGKKIILQQWDPVSWWTLHRGYGLRLSTGIQRLVALLERKVALNLVPSSSWCERLRMEGKDCIRIDNFFEDGEVERGIHLRVGSDYEVNAVFLGQFYSNTELNHLLFTLRDEALVMGKVIILHYFGSAINGAPIPGIKVVNHGYLSRAELVKRIAKWDVALLPYPMEDRFDQASKYSFPSKSRVYLAAGLPILAYCKSDSSPHKFYSENYQSFYHNMASSTGLRDFIKLIGDKDLALLKTRQSLSTRLIGEHFSSGVELAPLHQFLGNI